MMLERLPELEREFDDVEARLADPELLADQPRYQEVAKRYSELEQLVVPRPRAASAHRGPRDGQGDAERPRRRRPRGHAHRGQRGRGRHRAPRGRAAPPPAAEGPERRQERDRGDPRRRGRRGGQPLRPRPLRHVRRLRRPHGLEARAAGLGPVGHGRLQRRHLPPQGRGGVAPHAPGGRTAPGAAGAGHGEPGPHPHLVGHRHRAARGRGGRGRHRSRTTSRSTSTGRPARAGRA